MIIQKNAQPSKKFSLALAIAAEEMKWKTAHYIVNDQRVFAKLERASWYWNATYEFWHFNLVIPSDDDFLCGLDEIG